MYHREPRISLPAEVRVDAEYETDHHAVDTVTSEVFGTHCNHVRVAGEDGGQCLWQEL